MTRSKGRNKQRGNADNQPGVGEDTRIRIGKILEEFSLSSDEVYTFGEDLSKQDRAAIHKKCQKMGMRSKSSGRGNQRRISVYKKRMKNFEAVKENINFLSLSEESKGILLDVFMKYPPGQENEEEGFGDRGKKKNKSQGIRDDMFCRPSMDKDDITKKRHLLASRGEKTPVLKEINEKRTRLPIASSQDIITKAIESNQVVLICGETGCGKTTQVPQYILDNMWGKGKSCKIVCTQPRRISATSVAQRISQEIGEEIGGTVGYKIRMESKGGRQSSIVFCTNGVLLRVLVAEGSGETQQGSSKDVAKSNANEITHIILDEIHERDHFCDFMLAILRDLLPRYPHLRLVLMSATLDAERFSQYFGGCPVIHVPGFTYPVKNFYLEDVLSILKSTGTNRLNGTVSSRSSSDKPELSDENKAALDEAIDMACSDDEFDSLLELISSEETLDILNYQHSSSGVTPLMVLSGKGRVGDVCMLLSLGADCLLKARDGTTALDWAENGNQGETADIIRKHLSTGPSSSEEEKDLINNYLSTVNPELIDIGLIVRLLRKICADSSDGAILVFLPGWEDINKSRERLLSNSFFKDPSKFLVISLHSLVPAVEQKKVFERPPSGCRKIILSTNIAETAVTIDDVIYVIDSGRVKEKNYDPHSNVSTLQSAWISKASAKQRQGRAGRCQPGFCYHLYSKQRAASLPDFQVPEIRRMPIEDLCLQVKMLDPCYNIGSFLQKTLDPPVSETIRNAIAVLVDIGALSKDEGLTELGKKLGALPVHPRTSKMLLFAILNNCLDPALTLACAADFRSPFTIPMFPDEKKKAHAAKIELASLYGGHSDHLAVMSAFECWKNAKERRQEAAFCSQYFVANGRMFLLSGMRKQLQRELIRNGLIPEDLSTCNINSRDPGIIRAVLVAGLYPMVGRLLAPMRNQQKLIVENASGDRVRLHHFSTNSKISLKASQESPLVMYDEITRGDSGLFIRDCTVVGPLALSLLATDIVVAPGKDDEDDEESGSDDDVEEKSKNQGEDIMSCPTNTVNVIVDRWLPFESTALEVAQIYCLRERLSSAILFKIAHSREVLPPLLGASMQAISSILSRDGLSGIPVSLDSIDDLTSMVRAAEIGNSSTTSGRNAREKGPSSFLKSLFYHGAQQNGPYRYQNQSYHHYQNQRNFAFQRPAHQFNRVRIQNAGTPGPAGPAPSVYPSSNVNIPGMQGRVNPDVSGGVVCQNVGAANADVSGGVVCQNVSGANPGVSTAGVADQKVVSRKRSRKNKSGKKVHVNEP